VQLTKTRDIKPGADPAVSAGQVGATGYDRTDYA